jgi:hypothetical protein
MTQVNTKKSQIIRGSIQTKIPMSDVGWILLLLSELNSFEHIQLVTFYIVDLQNHASLSPVIYGYKLEFYLYPVMVRHSEVTFDDLSVVVEWKHSEK